MNTYYCDLIKDVKSVLKMRQSYCAVHYINYNVTDNHGIGGQN